jgi:hypothetical protein
MHPASAIAARLVAAGFHIRRRKRQAIMATNPTKKAPRKKAGEAVETAKGRSTTG